MYSIKPLPLILGATNDDDLFFKDNFEKYAARTTFFEPSAEQSLGSSDLWFSTPHERSYRDVYTAAFSAIYEAANLIILSLLLLVLPPTDKNNCRIQFHAQSILSADSCIESNLSPASARGYLVMIFH